MHRWRQALVLPDVLDLTFQGFSVEAFQLLDRLQANPHIEQYKVEREGIRHWLTAPFQSYRDDLVVNWVLPNQLPFETERNVFSRLLKNDFGAGGCHHHLWMSFYRIGESRLRDVQLVHNLSPEGFTLGLYLSRKVNLFERWRAANREEMKRLAGVLHPLLQDKKAVENWLVATLPLAEEFWVRSLVPRDQVLNLGKGLVGHALTTISQLWELYSVILFLKPPATT